MNVTDLYWNICGSSFQVDNISINTENQLLFGFLNCNKSYIHITIPYQAVQDIRENDAEYIKCMYYTRTNYNLKNTLSVFSKMDTYGTQLLMTKMDLKGDIYYVGPGLILDGNKNILFSVCYGEGREKKIVISPRVFDAKTSMNKYIISKIIPEFASHNCEVDIKLKNYMYLQSGITPEISKFINDPIWRENGGYKFIEMAT